MLLKGIICDKLSEVIVKCTSYLEPSGRRLTAEKIASLHRSLADIDCDIFEEILEDFSSSSSNDVKGKGKGSQIKIERAWDACEAGECTPPILILAEAAAEIIGNPQVANNSTGRCPADSVLCVQMAVAIRNIAPCISTTSVPTVSCASLIAM